MIPRRSIGNGMVLGISLVAILSYAMAADENAPKPKKPPADAAADKEQKDLSHFMRAKLEASGKILEGLAVEDFASDQRRGEEAERDEHRREMASLERRAVSQFQRRLSARDKDLMDAAEKENLDRAALKWMDATMNCIECHRYARGVMIAVNDGTTHALPEAVR